MLTPSFRQRPVPPAQLIEWLQLQLQPFLQSGQIFFKNATLPTCMVALTGWALDYPVVYVSHRDGDNETTEDEWELKPNCLGNQPLHVIRVSLMDLPWAPPNHALLSFSYPVALLTLEEQHQLQSDMVSKIQQRIVEGNLDARVSLTMEHVTLDRVAL